MRAHHQCIPRVLLATLLCCGVIPLRAADATIESRMAEAMEMRYRSPAEARALDAALRESLRTRPDPLVEARTWLNDCRSLIEDDNAAARAAAETGLGVLDADAADAPDLRVLLDLCRLYANEYLGSLDETLAGYEAAVARAERIGDRVVEAHALLRRGDLLGFLGRYADGLEDLQRARGIFRDNGLETESMTALQAIGLLRFRLGDHDSAIDMLREVIRAREQSGHVQLLSDSFYSLARAEEGKGDLDSALQNFGRTLEISRSLGNRTGMAYAGQAIGAIRLKQGEHVAAMEQFDAALATFRTVGDRDMIARMQASRAEALQQLGRIDEALDPVAEAIKLYREIANGPALERALGLQAALLIARRQSDAAIQALQSQRDVHLGNDAARRDQALARQRAQFDADRKEQENRMLAAQRAADAAELANSARLSRLQAVVIVLAIALLLVAASFLVRQVRLSRRLRVLALMDELTGIANRRNVMTFLDEQIRAQQSQGRALSVILLDIDFFKRLNDTWGHAAGDAALKAVSAACRRLMRGNDRIGRVGGEEFLVVLPGASLQRAGEVAERLCEEVRQLDLSAVAEGLSVTISLGVSEWRTSDPDSQAVVSRADAALYAAKTGGRNRVMLETPVSG